MADLAGQRGQAWQTWSDGEILALQSVFEMTEVGAAKLELERLFAGLEVSLVGLLAVLAGVKGDQVADILRPLRIEQIYAEESNQRPYDPAVVNFASRGFRLGIEVSSAASDATLRVKGSVEWGLDAVSALRCIHNDL